MYQAHQIHINHHLEMIAKGNSDHVKLLQVEIDQICKVKFPSYIAHFNEKVGETSAQKVRNLNYMIEHTTDPDERIDMVKRLFTALTKEPSGAHEIFGVDIVAATLNMSRGEEKLLLTIPETGGQELRIWLRSKPPLLIGPDHITCPEDPTNLLFGFYHKRDVVNELAEFLKEDLKIVEVQRHTVEGCEKAI